MNQRTSLEPTRLDFPCIDKSKITIDMLPQLAINDLLTITAKVKLVETAKEIKDGWKVQNISISDSKSSVRLALWNDFIGSSVKGETYRFVNVRLNKDKHNVLYLSTTKQN